MAQIVEREDEYVHVQFRDPDAFQTVREPNWAQWVAWSVSSSARVRIGKERGCEEWTVQSVLVDGEESLAREQAEEIAEKIDA
ncbi:hypothetical protein ACAH01_16160 (plasmid) [Halomicrobium sp. HM KBTZ05]|uniref:hypothetical protein n=1 Tax=Halomicrobium sp. HM KBTZ05 TaxID=3242663 RepID=UPI003557345E